MKKLIYYLQQLYRLSFEVKNRDEIVWNDLKRLHSKAGWKSGVYEKEKCIETVFELGDNIPGIFYYVISENNYHCRIKILDSYPVEMTTDLFILASHFNNLLKEGTVIINVNDQYVEYKLKCDSLIPFIYNGNLYDKLIVHYRTSKDVYKAFQRLITEQEEPAIIIADIVNDNNQSE